MSLNKFPIEGGVIEDATSRINDNNAVMLRQSGLNLVRQLEDRVVSFNVLGGEWAEAYIDSTGRLNSVVTADTTALFDVDKYKVGSPVDESGSDTTYDPDSVTSPESAFDYDFDTNASFSQSYATDEYFNFTKTLGKTFSTSKNISAVRIKAFVESNGNPSYGYNTSISLLKRVGTTWTTESTLYFDTGNGSNTYTYNDLYILDESIDGVAIRMNSQHDAGARATMRWYVIAYGSDFEEVEVIHNIPTGTLPSDVSSIIGVPKVEDYESGSNIQFKLTNSTEDSGWLNINEITEFSAFTSEPTQCRVKLVPSSAGVPSINGFSLIGDKA